MTKEIYMEGVSALRAMREDLPDGMWPELREDILEVSRLMREGRSIDWDAEADQIIEICHDWGFPSIFGEDLHTAI